MRTLEKIFLRPFPVQEGRYGVIKINAIIGLFVIFVLYIFEPFGISTLKSEKFLICSGFGIMTFLAAIVFDFVVGRVLKLKGKSVDWTFCKWILYNVGAMLTISLANFLFARILLFGFIDWLLLPNMIYGTFMIGIIPLVALGGFTLLIQEKKYEQIAENINHNIKVLSNDDSNDPNYLFNIPIGHIKYIEALQNYVTIGYTDSNNHFKKITERATIKNILEEISGSSIIQSHRSFLVNQKAIVTTSGNAQGLLLELSNCDKKIPVSRSYVPVFRD